MKLFEDLIVASKVELQDGDNIFVVEDDLMKHFYQMYNLTHRKMLEYPALSDLIENHIVENVADLPGKKRQLTTVFGEKYAYIPNVSVDGIPLTGEFDHILPSGVKVHMISLDGILLVNEEDLKTFASRMNKGEDLESTPIISSQSSPNIKLPELQYGELSVEGKTDHKNEDRIHTIDFATSKIHIIMDGHGGEEVVNYLMNDINRFAKLNNLVDPQKKRTFTKSDARELFADIDKDLTGFINEGSTCVIAVHNIMTKEVYFINLGDSRAIWKIGGGTNTSSEINYTKDQKPGDPLEKMRIEKLGGNVINAGVPRIDGKLAVSGGFGDYDLKPFVRNDPDIYGPYILSAGSFYVLATDGLWDVMKNEEVAKIVQNNSAPDAAYLLVRTAQNRKSTDDITVLVVKV